MRPLSFLLACFALVGCKRPPDAPAELDELVGYLYAHTPDDDPAPLQAGSVNLDVWLDAHIEETLEGYVVQNLSQEAVDALDDRERDLEGLAGAAVGHESEHSVEALAEAMILDDQTEVFPNNYSVYERDFLDDADCFAKGDCDWLEADVATTVSYAGLITVETKSRNQYRWIETEHGPAMIQRTWLQEPALVSLDMLEVDQQYYLCAFLPQEGGGSRSVLVTWVVARLTGDSVPEDAALNMVINSMAALAVDLDAYVEGK